MRSTQHTSNNDLLRAPPGATVDECRPLAITRIVYQDGIPAVQSFWQPTSEERAAIAAGALVRFECLGHTHPPMTLGVDGVPS